MAAIAIGHPLGASDARNAASTMRIGSGQGIATILENPANDNDPQPKKTLRPKSNFRSKG